MIEVRFSRARIETTYWPPLSLTEATPGADQNENSFPLQAKVKLEPLLYLTNQGKERGEEGLAQVIEWGIKILRSPWAKRKDSPCRSPRNLKLGPSGVSKVGESWVPPVHFLEFWVLPIAGEMSSSTETTAALHKGQVQRHHTSYWEKKKVNT